MNHVNPLDKPRKKFTRSVDGVLHRTTIQAISPLKIGNIPSFIPPRHYSQGDWPSSPEFVHYIAPCLLLGQANTGIALVRTKTPKFQSWGSMKSAEADDFC